MMDNNTRFWISSKVSQRREVEDARAVFQDDKSKTPKPIAIVHDGLNQKVERLNGVLRDREKVMRGMDTKESAQKTIDAFRIHYNFVRNHGSIGKTPEEKAGIKLNLDQNKIESLIKLATKTDARYLFNVY